MFESCLSQRVCRAPRYAACGRRLPRMWTSCSTLRYTRSQPASSSHALDSHHSSPLRLVTPSRLSLLLLTPLLPSSSPFLFSALKPPSLSSLLSTQLVRRTTFSVGGGLQLQRDVSALSALFLPLLAASASGIHVATAVVGSSGSAGGGAGGGARPSPLHRLHESCLLLTLDRAAREDLLSAILVDTPGGALPRAEHEASLRCRLEECGVFRLLPGEVSELLASMQDDESRVFG